MLGGSLQQLVFTTRLQAQQVYYSMLPGCSSHHNGVNNNRYNRYMAFNAH